MINGIYGHGLDILGAGLGSRIVLIRLRDPNALAKREGGALAAFAASLAPDTVEQKVYDEVVKRIREDFDRNKIDAEVTQASVTDARPPIKSVEGPTLLKGVAVGAGATILLGALVKWVAKR